jgi:glyoxylase-like metal-dependent hydrolase (beta-lactamase superfamily II)
MLKIHDVRRCLVGLGAVIAVAGALAGQVQAEAPQAAAGQATPPAPLVKENATVKVAAHTFVIPDMNVGGVPNVGIVVGNRATLVIDTGLGQRNGEAVMREMRKVSKNSELYLATTHFHPEHDLGASAFPAATKMIRSRDQQKDIDEFGLELAKTFSSRSPAMADLLKGAEFRKADLFFEREHELDLGGVRVRIMAVGPTHTRGDTVFLVEGDDVLFAGDVAMPNLPAFASPYSSVRVWLTTLDRLAALKPARVVPSHGTMGDRSMIDAYRTFLETVQTRARELKAKGQSVDAAMEAVTKELQAKYANQAPARIGPAVRVAFNEAP